VADVDREDWFFVSSKAGPSGYHLSRDNIGVLIVHRPECGEIEVGVWVTRADVEAWGVIVSFGYDGTVGGCFPFEDSAVV
jgi:hypothetical protein